MTCATCVFWNAHTGDKAYLGKGYCASPKFRNLGNNDNETANNDELAYWSDKGEFNSFETGKDFGCIHHKATQPIT